MNDLHTWLEAFDRVAASTSGADEALEVIRENVVADPQFLADPRKLRHLFSDALDGFYLRWPWFELWRDHFVKIGEKPRMWTEDGRQASVASLLCHTIRRSQRRTFRGEGALCYFWPMDDEPPAIQKLVEEQIAAYVSGIGPVIFPPFWPGDRTSCKPSIKLRHGRQDPDRLCPFRGFGD